MTIIATVLISAFNALTLSPALCALFLRHSGPRRGLMGYISRGIDGVRDGYALIVRKLLRFSVLGVVLVVAFGIGVGGLARVTPTSFLPEEDQGAFFVQVQLPDAVSVARTSEVVGQVEAVLKSMPQVKDTVAIIGYSFLDSFSSSNTAFMVATLQPLRTASRRRIRSGPDRQDVRRRPAGPHRDRPAVQPAAGHRPGHDRRFRIPAREFRGSGSGHHGKRGPGDHRRHKAG